MGDWGALDSRCYCWHMRFIDVSPVLFLISALLVIAVASTEIVVRQLGGAKAALAFFADVKPVASLPWSLLGVVGVFVALIVASLLMIPGTH